MTSGKTSYQWLSEKIKYDQVVLTVSRGLAKKLTYVFNQNQQENHKLAWNSPHIFYWRDWLKTLFLSSNISDNPLLINNRTASILWEQCIKEVDDNPLMNQHRLADEADQSFRILSDYCVPLRENFDLYETAEVNLFSQILSLYERQLTKRNWLHPAMLAGYILENNLINHDSLIDVKEITLIGFYKTPKILSELITVLQTHITLNYISVKQPDNNPVICPYKDQSAEFRAVGAWAYKKLMDAPQSRIGILIDDNHQSRKIKRYIMEGLSPGWQYRQDRQHFQFIHSSSDYLITYPMIYIASLLLRWYHNELSSREISLLLRSKLFQNIHSEGSYKLEEKLRLYPDKDWFIDEYIEIFKDDALESELTILDKLEVFYKSNVSSNSHRYIRDWLEVINSDLKDIGWIPIEKKCNLDNQLIGTWNELINEMETTQIILKKTSFAYLVNRLLIAMENSLFEVDQFNNNISVMTYEEAAGFEFDHLWISGMDHETWPRKMKPIPLLSNKVQKNYDIPNYDASLSFDVQQELLSLLMSGSQAPVLSYAISKNDLLLEPTTMMNFESINYDDYPDPDWYLKPFLGNNLIEMSEDPPKTSHSERLKGGTGTIQSYLSDPFSAFVKGRLGVTPLNKFISGIGPLLRGSLLHDSLAELYINKPSLTDIKSWSASQKKQYILDATKKIFSKEIARNNGVLKKLFVLEESRIKIILFNYLSSEIHREFFKIIELEKSISLTHAQLKVKLRVDRIDLLHDKSFHVIDYKTGTLESITKRDGSIKNIQLFVYAAALEYQPETLSFINFKDLNTVNISTIGLHHLNNSMKENFKSTNLASGIQEVKDILEKISSGDTRINSKTQLDINSRSRYLQILSRIRAR